MPRVEKVNYDTYLDVLDDKVVEDDSVSCRTETEATGGEVNSQTDLCGPRRVGIRESQDL